MMFNKASIFSMLMLYAGKTSGLLVALLFLPFYNKLMGPEQFGVVAVILSFQALLVMMDLGLSTLVSRAVALAEVGIGKLVRTADVLLTVLYGGLLLGIALVKWIGGFSSISWLVGLGSVILFWALVLQNVYYGAVIARREYILGSAIQVVGGLCRAGITAVALLCISATLETFIVAQVSVALVQAAISRVVCLGRTGKVQSDGPVRWSDVIALSRSGGALILFSIAGAAVTQLDKPLISIFTSAAEVAPYYLASLLCATPISILASPISQFFQPLFFSSVASGLSDRSLKLVLKKFVVSIFLFTIVPSFFIWLFRDEIVELWLGPAESTVSVSRYVAILLPGLIVGALGFVPYCLLVFSKDFKFQATMSMLMTVVTLALVAFASSVGSVEWVCIVYALYHISSTIFSWARACTLAPVRTYAVYSALLTLKIVVGFLIVAAALVYIPFR